MNIFCAKHIIKIPAASRRALLTDRREMRKNCEADLFVRAGFSFFVFLQAFLQKNKCAKLGIAKNGFPKAAKSVGKQVIKNRSHFYTNVPMEPCPNVTMI